MSEKDIKARHLSFLLIEFLLLVFLLGHVAYYYIFIFMFLTLLDHYAVFSMVSYVLNDRRPLPINCLLAIIRCILIIVLSYQIDAAVLMKIDFIICFIGFFAGFGLSLNHDIKIKEKPFDNEYSPKRFDKKLTKLSLPDSETLVENFKALYDKVMLISIQNDKSPLSKLTSKTVENIIKTEKCYIEQQNKTNFLNTIENLHIRNITKANSRIYIEVEATEIILEPTLPGEIPNKKRQNKTFVFAESKNDENNKTEWIIENIKIK